MIPDWMYYVPGYDHNHYYVNLEPCKCDRCAYQWYPRIKMSGKIILNTCPKCRSKLWNISKVTEKK
jgi:predicted Zn-ribbon and HTH transcriptional regulator